MTVQVLAPAKLTISLRITGRCDDGYHLIDAEMLTLDLADVLTIGPDRVGLTASGRYAATVPLGDGNLVSRALAAAGRRARVHIDKRIPPGGGLGGGSADAAAILRWAGFTDLLAASRIGADVPFCLIGGRATVRGIGEEIVPLEPVDRMFTLIIPPLACSTPDVYRAWDDLGALSSQRQPGGLNDLEAAALVVQPGLAEWRDRITEACGRSPSLAGSGSTWFVEGHHPELAEALTDATVVMTRTSN